MSRKPELLCIGAQKAGTTWLHDIFGQHPEIWTPVIKELHFFDYKFTSTTKNWAQRHVSKGIEGVLSAYLTGDTPVDPAYLQYLNKILENPKFNGTWYKHVFSIAPKNAKCLDVTPEYSCITQEGVDFVGKFLPDTKFIYLIRDPVDRAISQLRMQITRTNKIPATDEEWVNLASSDLFSNRGNFAEYVPRWLNKFGEERMLFLPFKQLKNDPIALLRKCEKFAGVQSWEYDNINTAIHKSTRHFVPEIVREFFEQEFMSQYQFLESHFEKDFIDLI